VGAGVRYDLGFAPLRFDVAVPLDPDEAGADYALYISLGQAF
jgi:translocation and assembly module TamA